MQSAGYFACLSCQTELQATAAAVTLGHYFLTVVDVYWRGCFADLSTAAAVVAGAAPGLEDYSAVQPATSDVAACHQHCSVAQVAEGVVC